jgi:riboflavin synthase
LFTGLVSEVGRVAGKQVASRLARLSIQMKNKDFLRLGDSVAVNGACLTVTKLTSDGFVADVMPKTWASTNLKSLRVRDPVNLEPALKLGDPLGGHMVSGHVDGVGQLVELRPEKNAVLMKVSIGQEELLRYMVTKGSIALDGVSLTIQEIAGDKVLVSLIPHTFKSTRFCLLKTGDFVNVEVDMAIKQMVEKQLQPPQRPGITLEFLKKHGY